MSLQEYTVPLAAPLAGDRLAKLLEGLLADAALRPESVQITLRFGDRPYEDQFLDYDLCLTVDANEIYASFRSGTLEQKDALRRGLTAGVLSAGLDPKRIVDHMA